MKTESLVLDDGYRSTSLSLRDLIGLGFRRKRAIILCFLGILSFATLVALWTPSEYTATTKFLVEHGRKDPVVSPQQDPQATFRGDVTEAELNSEVELLQTEDVLRQVVVSCGLQRHKSSMPSLLGSRDESKQIAKAISGLRRGLKIQLINKSNLIGVSYTSSDPQLAVRVLTALDDAYITKNVAVHRRPGQFEFFDQETERYKKELSDAEAQLKAFSDEDHGVAPQLARDIALQKLNEFEASWQQNKSEMAATEQRIQALESQAGTTPQRLITQARQTDDAGVLQGFKTTLMNLELKRTELLTKYQPTYPLVQEVDKQIADTRSSIASEESKPVREETTDRNPTYAWINAELAKAKAEHSGLQARAAATQAIVSNYQQKTRELEQKGIIQQNLLRTMKTSEENYLLYQRKREEARMMDALDRTRIVNVAIAEQPTVPALPSNSPWRFLLMGGFLATIVSLGMAFTLDYLDSSFRTRSEVIAELNIPVLAAVPYCNSRGLTYYEAATAALPIFATQEQDERENGEKNTN
jgi:uncharacterized protein involved in exopolysaccharide biosynthesis